MAFSYEISEESSFYNWKNGCDWWQKDSDDSYLMVPFDSDGNSILTDGDALTGYTWIMRATAGAWVNNPFTTFNWPVNADMVAADLPIKVGEGLGYLFDYAALTGYKTDASTNYVDTGVAPSAAMDFEIQGRFIDSDQSKTEVVFGSREDVSTDKAFLGYSAGAFIFNWGSVGGTFATADGYGVNNTSHIFKKDGDDFLADGVVQFSGLDSETFVNSNNVYVFGLNDNGTLNFPSCFVLESFKLWISSVLTIEAVPNGSGGFTVSTGTFTVNGDALTALSTTEDVGTAKDITYLDRNADVYDSPEISYHSIFSNTSTDGKWKNILAYNRALDHDEWRALYDYINHPNPLPLIYVTNDR